MFLWKIILKKNMIGVSKTKSFAIYMQAKFKLNADCIIHFSHTVSTLLFIELTVAYIVNTWEVCNMCETR